MHDQQVQRDGVDEVKDRSLLEVDNVRPACRTQPADSLTVAAGAAIRGGGLAAKMNLSSVEGADEGVAQSSLTWRRAFAGFHIASMSHH